MSADQMHGVLSRRRARDQAKQLIGPGAAPRLGQTRIAKKQRTEVSRASGQVLAREVDDDALSVMLEAGTVLGWREIMRPGGLGYEHCADGHISIRPRNGKWLARVRDRRGTFDTAADAIAWSDVQLSP